jgi:DNA-binding beta-propeller fold protein YncE
MEMRNLIQKIICFFVLVLFAGVIPAEGNQIPVVTNMCSLVDIGVSSPTGLGYNSSTGHLAVVDNVDDMAYIIDKDCNMMSSFATPGTNPTGITYDSSSGMYGIIDSSADEVFFTDESGTLVGQCDLTGIGALNTTGIAYNSASGNFALTNDGSDDEIYIIDDSVMDGSACNLIGQFDTLAFGSSFPSDIAYLPDSDQYAVIDNFDDEVYIISAATGIKDTQFDTNTGIGSANPTGIAYVPAMERFYIVDSTADTLYEVDARGTSNFLCDTGGFVAPDPTDITFNSNTNQMVFVDNTTDAFFIVNFACGLDRQVGTLPFGSDNPTGIAYIPGTNQLAITDATDDEIYFVGYDSELLEFQCDTESLGIASPSGIDYNRQLDILLVTDDADDSLFLLDRSCKPIHQHSAGSLELSSGSTVTTGAAVNIGTGTFLVTDSSRDDVFIANYEGMQERRFDTAGLGLLNISGITALSSDTFLVSDKSLNDIYVLTVPLLKESRSLSGQFVSNGVIKGVYWIFERGGGHFTGTLFGILPVYGYYDAATDDISLCLRVPSGASLCASGTVVNLDTISLPGPLFGTLTRLN